MRKFSIFLCSFAFCLICLLLLPVKAQAVSKSDLAFTLNSNGNSYSIKATNADISGELIIPDEYDGKPVTTISPSAFRWCKNLTSVTVGNNVTYIGQNAFEDCENLITATIPDSVKTIGDNAFYNCKKLTAATIGNGVTSIGSYLFYDCISLSSVTIGSSVNTIPYQSFYNCDSLTAVTIPDSATKIEYRAFYNCDNLTDVTIGNGVTTIKSEAFSRCANLTNVSIGNNITSIEINAFSGCAKLNYNLYDNANYLGNESNPYVVLMRAANKSITQCTVHPATKYICNSTFADCPNLTSVTIPYIRGNHFGQYFKTLIYDSSFQDYGDLSAYVQIRQAMDYGYAIPKSLKTVTVTGDKIPSNGFLNCTNLTEVILQNGVSSIGSSAFAGCVNLTDISIPDSVTSIGEKAFSGCDRLNYTVYGNAYYLGNANNPYVILNKADSDSITEIEIHSGTKFISNYTFEGTGLTKVTLPDSVTFIGSSAFADCSSLTDVYYNGTQDQWKAINMNKDNGALRNATLHFTLCAEAHKWDSGVVTKPATKNEEGIKTFTCSSCNETRTEPIPKLTASASSTTASTAKPGATTAATSSGKPIAKPNPTQSTAPAGAVPNQPESNTDEIVSPTAESAATTPDLLETAPTAESTKDKGSNTGLIIAVVAIVAILAPASGIAAFFFFKKKLK